jgi:hypothetical protein
MFTKNATSYSMFFIIIIKTKSEKKLLCKIFELWNFILCHRKLLHNLNYFFFEPTTVFQLII